MQSLNLSAPAYNWLETQISKNLMFEDLNFEVHIVILASYCKYITTTINTAHWYNIFAEVYKNVKTNLAPLANVFFSKFKITENAIHLQS